MSLNRILFMFFTLIPLVSVAEHRDLNCQSNGNPLTYFYVDLAANGGEATGELGTAFAGFSGAEYTSAGNDNIEIRIHPKKLLIRIISKKNSPNEFTFTTSLREMSRDKNGAVYRSTITGTITEKVLRCELLNRKLVDKFIRVIVKHRSLDKEIRLSSAKHLDTLKSIDTKDIESIDGVTVEAPDIYPAFKTDVAGGVPNFGD